MCDKIHCIIVTLKDRIILPLTYLTWAFFLDFLCRLFSYHHLKNVSAYDLSTDTDKFISTDANIEHPSLMEFFTSDHLREVLLSHCELKKYTCPGYFFGHTNLIWTEQFSYCRTKKKNRFND